MSRVTSECITWSWIKSPLNASCYRASRRNLHIHIYRETNASLPYLDSPCLCSLQRVTPYPTLEVVSYLLLLTCRLQMGTNPLHLEFYPCIRERQPKSTVALYSQKSLMFWLIDSNVYSDAHEINTHIHSLKTQGMNTHVHSLDTHYIKTNEMNIHIL